MNDTQVTCTNDSYQPAIGELLTCDRGVINFKSLAKSKIQVIFI